MTTRQISVIISGYVKHKFEFDNENGFHIPPSILSENRNNERYADPSSVQISLYDVNGV